MKQNLLYAINEVLKPSYKAAEATTLLRHWTFQLITSVLATPPIPRAIGKFEHRGLVEKAILPVK